MKYRDSRQPHSTDIFFFFHFCRLLHLHLGKKRKLEDQIGNFFSVAENGGTQNSTIYFDVQYRKWLICKNKFKKDQETYLNIARDMKEW